MTTQSQNDWAQYLEDASAREIRQMAEYAIDHIDDESELLEIRDYISNVLSREAA